MNGIKRCFLFSVLLMGLWTTAQQPAYYKDIQAFKKQDSLQAPPKNAILLIGSSSFTRWKDVHDYFPGYALLNRGFGGSSLLDLIRYANDIIFPYQPKQIVIYCGENNLAASDSVTSQMVVERFKALFGLIRKQLPSTPIAFISLKPSPSRQHLMAKMVAANRGIKKYLKRKKNTAYIDVYHAMLTTEGLPMSHIFVEDKLHMNAQGYAIWKTAIEPYLLK